jgi:hypothetical protein
VDGACLASPGGRSCGAPAGELPGTAVELETLGHFLADTHAKQPGHRIEALPEKTTHSINSKSRRLTPLIPNQPSRELGIRHRNPLLYNFDLSSSGSAHRSTWNQRISVHRAKPSTRDPSNSGHRPPPLQGCPSQPLPSGSLGLAPRRSDHPYGLSCRQPFFLGGIRFIPLKDSHYGKIPLKDSITEK